MIDFSKPMRIAASRRQVFVTGYDNGLPVLDTTETGRRTGFAFNDLDHPVHEGCPYGQVENYDPLQGIISFEDVLDPSITRDQRRLVEQNADNPLWGIF